MGPSIQASDVGFGVHIPFVAMLGLQLQLLDLQEPFLGLRLQLLELQQLMLELRELMLGLRLQLIEM